jgi:hypothetical protein
MKQTTILTCFSYSIGSSNWQLALGGPSFAELTLLAWFTRASLVPYTSCSFFTRASIIVKLKMTPSAILDENEAMARRSQIVEIEKCVGMAERRAKLGQFRNLERISVDDTGSLLTDPRH